MCANRLSKLVLNRLHRDMMREIRAKEIQHKEVMQRQPEEARREYEQGMMPNTYISRNTKDGFQNNYTAPYMG